MRPQLPEESRETPSQSEFYPVLFAEDYNLYPRGQSLGQRSGFTHADDRVSEIVGKGGDQIDDTIFEASHAEPMHDMNDPHLHRRNSDDSWPWLESGLLPATVFR